MPNKVASIEMLPVPQLPHASLSLDPDTEASAATTAIHYHDPLNLRARLVEANYLESASKHFTFSRKKKQYKELQQFYDDQNEHIGNLLKPMQDHTAEANAAEDAARLKVKIAVWGSFVCNLALAGLQLYAAISSLSLSFFATAADSVFDPFASFMLAYVHRRAKKLNHDKWPTGGSRLETVANIIYAFLMIIVNCILIVESIRSIAEGNPNETFGLNVPAIVSVSIALATKLCLFFYCWTLKANSPQVQILWEDHRNDLPVNSFGILTNAGGAKLRWWIDPMGAMIIATGVIISWSITAYSEFALLIGKTAEPDFLQFIIYKAMTFSDEIKAIDSCKAYSSGPDLYIELDIVMAPETPLRQAHDLSQALQDQLEALPGVARVFVHVDHEVDHAPEHRKER